MGFLGTSCLGELPVSALEQRQIRNYTHIYSRLARLSPAAQQEIGKQAFATLRKLPLDKQRQVAAMTQRTVENVDPREATGLGVTGAISTAATIAGVVATLGTLGLQAWSFADARKDRKEQEKIARERAEADQRIVNLQIAEAKARQEREQKLYDAQMAQATAPTSAPPSIGATNTGKPPLVQTSGASASPSLAPYAIAGGLAVAAALAFS